MKSMHPDRRRHTHTHTNTHTHNFVDRHMYIFIEITDDMDSSLQENKKRFAQNGAVSIPIGMTIARFNVTFPTLKYQFSFK